jgi:hypothetical protein
MGPNSTRLRKDGSKRSVKLLNQSSMFCDRAAFAKSPHHSSPECEWTRSANNRERMMRQFHYGAVGSCGLIAVPIWGILHPLG